MDKIQEIRQKIQALLAEANVALKSGDLETSTAKRAEIEKFNAQLIEFQRLAELEESFAKSASMGGAAVAQRPPLPTQAADPIMQPMPAKSSPTPETPATKEDIQKSAYIMRFGDQPSAVKGILADLHGSDPEGQYFGQKMAFNKYLRRDWDGLNDEEKRLAKTIVLTPQLVKSAIEQGIESVSSLKATMVEAVESLGGVAVPVDFQMRVIEGIQGFTVVRGRAQRDQTSRDKVEYPKITGNGDQYSSTVRVTWVDETPPNAGPTNLTFGSESIPVHTVMAETPLSRNLIEDAAFDIEGYLTRKLAEASGIDEDIKFLIGSGVGTPQGILPGGTNALNLTRRPSGSTSGILWDKTLAMYYAIPSQYRRNCNWIAARYTYEHIATIKNATSGDYLWQPFQFVGGLDLNVPRLHSFPTLEQESIPQIANGAFPLIFGDLRGYQIIDRVGMTVERYLDSTTARQNMIMYVMRRRLGGQVVEPWRFSVMQVATN